MAGIFDYDWSATYQFRFGDAFIFIGAGAVESVAGVGNVVVGYSDWLARDTVDWRRQDAVSNDQPSILAQSAGGSGLSICFDIIYFEFTQTIKNRLHIRRVVVLVGEILFEGVMLIGVVRSRLIVGCLS